MTYADPDPNAGIGGYRRPRGPYGATGYEGSTSATRENPPAAEGKLADDYTNRHPRRRWRTFLSQQAEVIPDSVVTKGPANARNPDEVRSTEKRPHLVISRDIPGGLRQRNTVYYGGVKARPDGENRYVFGGTNGGTDTWGDELRDRHMPYTGHRGTLHSRDAEHGNRSIRGAYMDGERYYQAPGSSLGLDQGGAYGKRIRGKERHRPTVYKEPAPWTGKFYDTTREVGAPDSPARNSQVVSAVYESPSVRRKNRGGRW